MIKVTPFNDIVNQSPINIIASYKGYTDYAGGLDSHVNEMAKMGMRDINAVRLDFPDNSEWWYPPYSLQFEGDSESITLDNAIIGQKYQILKKINAFSVNPYRSILPNYGNKTPENIFNEYLTSSLCGIGDEIELLQIIPFRKEFNDIIALCQHADKNYTYVPLTSLYGEPIPMYRPRKFVYEYNQWKDS